ncbi:MAG: ABC transporter ATP-binding protein [Promethearchaeia archaeon]
MVSIKLENISKSFRKFKVLDNISFEIKDKEYFIILGPTGAGKTTLLKIISGLIKPDTGKVYYDNKDVTNLDPSERNLGFMFENYALFPHMTIYDNIAYSARVHARDPELTKTIVDQILMMTLLTGRNEAYPNEMSGGMQQRVALCRALMNLEQAKLLILDEPLKALDAGLRMSLRRELLSMAKSKELQLTVIHVTNEEEEAMMLADKIAIINKGKIIQIGTPYEIYYQPKNLFVANFLSELNIFEGICAKDSRPSWNINRKSKKGDKFFAKIQEQMVPLPVDIGAGKLFAGYIKKDVYNKFKHGDKVLLIARANHMKIRLGKRDQEKNNALVGTITRRKFMGVFYRFEIAVNINGQEKNIIVINPATAEMHKRFKEGLQATVYFPKEFGIIFKHPGEDEIKEILTLK